MKTLFDLLFDNNAFAFLTPDKSSPLVARVTLFSQITPNDMKMAGLGLPTAKEAEIAAREDKVVHNGYLLCQ